MRPDEISLRMAFKAQRRRAAIVRVRAAAEEFARSVGRIEPLDARRIPTVQPSKAGEGPETAKGGREGR